MLQKPCLQKHPCVKAAEGIGAQQQKAAAANPGLALGGLHHVLDARHSLVCNMRPCVAGSCAMLNVSTQEHLACEPLAVMQPHKALGMGP